MDDSTIPNALQPAFVSSETCVFFETPNGFLGAEINGERFGRVILLRALPLTAPADYISICDITKKEIAMLRSISEFSTAQQMLINKELSLRYFCPEISRIIGIKEKMGHFYFDVMIGEHKKSFTVKDLSKSVRQNGGHVDITDMDGNRYRIPALSEISPKSRRMIEPYLY